MSLIEFFYYLLNFYSNKRCNTKIDFNLMVILFKGKQLTGYNVIADNLNFTVITFMNVHLKLYVFVGMIL